MTILDLDILLNWYSENKRDLPWRSTHNPYFIWLSEIILQQTRVNQGIAYYYRFIENFPTIQSLAHATEDEVLKHWQGLGYYSRARNLHKAANQIIVLHNGVFPVMYQDVISLCGVGEYTAAAICSFAYNLPYAVVDGNVYRVLSRLFGIDTPIDTGVGKRIFADKAQSILNINQPALHNQAMMEFGALQCVPANPNCDICPFESSCIARATDRVSLLPIKLKKTKVVERYFNYLFIENEGNTFLQKRTANDIWRNLYEFPLIESTTLLEVHQLMENEFVSQLFDGVNEVKIESASSPFKHVLTHRIIYARFFKISISNVSQQLLKMERLPILKINTLAVSRLMEIYIENEVLA